MHRTAAQVHVHFVEYLETPPSMNGIPSLASLYRYSPQLGRCQRCSSTNFRSQTACNKPGNENRPIAIFFQDKAPSVRDRGQDKEFRDCPGRSGTLGNYGFPITYRKMNYFGGHEIRAKQKSSMRFYVATCILHVHCAPWDSTRKIKAIGQWWRLQLVT